MRDYQMFSLMDFIQDEDFIRWVREKNPADNRDWEEWLVQHPDKRSLVAEARRMLESIEIPQKVISQRVIQLETQKLLEAIGAGVSAVETADRPAITLIRRTRKWWLAAAVLAALAVSVFYFQKSWDSPPQKFAYSSLVSSRHLIERVNNSEKTDTLLFPDGSEVHLASNSRISYAAGFDTAAVREVYLSGQAFFQVVKNPRHPFRVIAGEVVTKVLGTSFCVRSFEKDTTIQVVVRTGKVSVYSQAIPGEPVNLPTGHSVTSGSRGEIILTCNQRLVYKKTAQKFEKLLLESPTLVAPGMTDVTMVYEDTPLEEVFTRLSKAYGINIVYDNELVKKSTVTADLKGETFYHKLDLICRAIGADYEVIDGQVVISFSNTKPNLNE